MSLGSVRSRFSLWIIFQDLEFWILLIIGVLYFYRPLFGKETFYFRDLYNHFYPQKLRFVELVKSQGLPLWDPYLHGGQPFLADMNNVALYPGNILYLFIEPLTAFNIDIVFHVLLSTLGMYALARVLGIRPVFCLLAGAIYGFSGYTLSLTNLLNRLIATPYLPFVLLTWHLFLTEGKWKWFILSVFLGVFQFFSGAPEMTLITLLTLFCWSMAYPYNTGIGQRIFSVFCLAIFIAGLASIQLIPMWEMVKQSARGLQIDYASFAAWPLHPKRLPELILPGFFGYTDRLGTAYYWGAYMESMRSPYILSIYIGCLTWTLAIAGGLSKAQHKLPLSIRRLLLVLVFVSILLSLGPFLPFFPWLYDSIPGIRIFRYPIKFLVAALFPISLLAAFWADVLLGKDARLSRKVLLLFWGMALILILLTVVFLLVPGIAEWLQNSYFQNRSNIMNQGIKSSLIHTSFIVLLAALVFLYRHMVVRKEQPLLLTAILILDLLVAGRSVTHYAPRELLFMTPPNVLTVKQGMGNGRLYRAPSPGDIIFKIPENHVLYVDLWHLETMHNYVGALYSIPLIFHEDYDRMANKRVFQLAEKIRKASWPQRFPLLDSAAVERIITFEQITAPGWTQIARLPNRSNKVARLYAKPDNAARVRLVNHWKNVRSLTEAIDLMSRPDFDPHIMAVVEGNEEKVEGEGSAEIQTLPSTILFQHYRVRNERKGYLVFSEPYYPGWTVSVNGKQQPVLAANAAFSAILLPPGLHDVQRRYQPFSVRIGILSSLSFLMLLSITPFLPLKSQRIWQRS